LPKLNQNESENLSYKLLINHLRMVKWNSLESWVEIAYHGLNPCINSVPSLSSPAHKCGLLANYQLTSSFPWTNLLAPPHLALSKRLCPSDIFLWDQLVWKRSLSLIQHSVGDVSNVGCVNIPGRWENGGREDCHLSGHPTIWLPVARLSSQRQIPRSQAGKSGAVLVPYVGRPGLSSVLWGRHLDWLECTVLGGDQSQSKKEGPISSVWWERC